MEKEALNEQFRNRTKALAERIVKMYASLPKTAEASTIGKQLIRSATSTAANYRAGRRTLPVVVDPKPIFSPR